MQDPQSLHKYAYVHGDPIQGLDPTGESAIALGIVGGFLAAQVISSHLRAQHASAVTTTFATVASFLLAYQSVQFALWGAKTGLRPEWYKARDVPSKAANVLIRDYEDNVYRQLTSKARPGVDPNTGEYRNQDDIEWGARLIARNYVLGVLEGTAESIDENTRTETLFGTGGRSGWWGNFDLPSAGTNNCDQWCDLLTIRFDFAGLKSRGWIVQRVTDSSKFGDHSAKHNYFIVGFRVRHEVSPTIPPGETSSVRMGMPDWVLDPWIRGRPDVYDPQRHFFPWPADIVDPDFE